MFDPIEAIGSVKTYRSAARPAARALVADLAETAPLDQVNLTPEREPVHFQVSYMTNQYNSKTMRRQELQLTSHPKGKTSQELARELQKHPASSKAVKTILKKLYKHHRVYDGQDPRYFLIEDVSVSNGDGKVLGTHHTDDKNMMWDLWEVELPNGGKAIDYINRTDPNNRVFGVGKPVRSWMDK